VDYPPTKQELEHAAQTLKNCSKKIILVYAVLFYNREPEFVLRSMRALRFDNNSVRDTSRLIKIAKSPIMNDDYNLRKFLSANQDLFNEVFELRRLFGRDEGDKPRRCTAIIANGDCLHVKDLCVNGKDLLNIGLNGKEIGDVLARMLDIVLRDPTLNTKDKLLRSVLKCSL
jgi:tRNA nucleotidyltransferase (CCA-adding enzyme)